MLFQTSSKKLISDTLPNVPTKQRIGQQIYRLVVYDSTSKNNFLIDTGADVSVIPPSYKDRFSPSKTTLFAANGSVIKTYGEKSLIINLGLRRAFNWTFLIADVTRAIIGADFIRKFGLLIDLKGNRLIDSTTQLKVKTNTTPVNATEVTIKLFDTTQPFAHFLADFQELVHMNRNPSNTTGITHYIETTGPPVFARPRRLDYIFL